MALPFEFFGAAGLWVFSIAGLFFFLFLLRSLFLMRINYYRLRMYKEGNRLEEYHAELTIQIIFFLVGFIGTILFFPSTLTLAKHICNIFVVLDKVQYK